MQFRFTIYNDSLAPTGTTIKQPLGWKDCRLVLERHPDYHSLVEYFEGDFIFFGSGLTLIQSIETTYGPDARPRIVVEVSFNINVWEEIFDGLLDLSLLEEYSKGESEYKMKIPIVRNDFWTKFINRKSIPIDLASITDLDGGTRVAVSSFTLPMPSQVIDVNYYATYYNFDDSNAVPIEYVFDYASDLRVGQVTLPVIQLNEVDTVFDLPSMVVDVTGVPTGSWGTFITPNLTAKFKGTYQFDLCLYMSTSRYMFPVPLGGDRLTAHGMYVYKNGVLQGSATVSQFGVDGMSGRTKFEYSQSFDLEAGDSLTYILYSGIGGNGTFYIMGNNWFENEVSFISFSATTLFDDTTCEAFKLKEAAESILSKIVSADDVVESDALDACAGKYSLQRGLQIRGYSLTDKPFTMSFDDWWTGANPILNLGLGYTSDDKIKIEDKSYFYNPSPSVYLSNVANMVRSYDTDKFVKSVQIGYEKGLVESKGGLDDTQTKRTWRTALASIGKDEKLLSKFVAASLAIEETRRQRIEEGKDWRLDEEIFIIALDSSDEPEVGNAFASISNLVNSDTRYNTRLSCARNFVRWLNWFTSSIQHDPTLVFNYASGEGNVNMTSELNSSDCEYSDNHTLTENQDIDQGTSLFLNEMYTFTHPLSWTGYKRIRDNAEKAIGITDRDGGDVLPHFITRLAYSLISAKGDFKTLLASRTAVTGGIFDETFDTTFE